MATEAQNFVEDHGYQRGSQEAKLVSMGYNLDDVRSQYGSWGNNMNPGELRDIVSQLGPSPIQQQGIQAQQQLQTIASQEYAFDPQQYLPGIQEQAQGVFAPQRSQLQAIRELQSLQYQEERLTTEEQFNKQLKSEIESINARGAYFGGGAIAREQEIGDVKLRALNMLGLQAQAADFNNLAQQGILQAEESQFIQDRLYNAEAGAYARWSDQRTFSYQAALQQYQIYKDERDFVRGVFESDRTFDQNTYQFEQNRELMKQQYGLDDVGLARAEEEWNLDMKLKGLSVDQALINLKKNPAVTKNTGIFGNLNGKDLLDAMAEVSEMLNIPVKTGDTTGLNEGKIIPLKSYGSAATDLNRENKQELTIGN